jgi:hypothetical protein
MDFGGAFPNAGGSLCMNDLKKIAESLYKTSSRSMMVADLRTHVAAGLFTFAHDSFISSTTQLMACIEMDVRSLIQEYEDRITRLTDQHEHELNAVMQAITKLRAKMGAFGNVGKVDVMCASTQTSADLAELEKVVKADVVCASTQTSADLAELEKVVKADVMCASTQTSADLAELEKAVKADVMCASTQTIADLGEQAVLPEAKPSMLNIQNASSIRVRTDTGLNELESKEVAQPAQTLSSGNAKLPEVAKPRTPNGTVNSQVN